ncbi:MAG: SulP family inorganic anion transporter [Gemmatimonadales bacterium]
MRLKAGDVVAGLSVASILIPQAVAYAALAGMPPQHGLYAAALPPLAAAFFASSRYLQAGPVAITSLLTFGALAAFAAPETTDYVALAALLAVLVGVVRVVLGLLRAGWLAYLMSQPVLTGFTTAAAILIISSQLPTALGTQPTEGSLVGRAAWSLRHVEAWEPASVMLALLTGALILGGRRLHRLFPGVLVAVVLGILFSVISGYSGAVVGQLPASLPPISANLPWGSAAALIVPAAIIALVGFAEPAAIARTFAAQDRERWNPSREFVAQGVANLASGISGGFPVGGSFSRSSINRLSGGRSRWSGAVTGTVLLLFLPFANVLSPLPRAILGAIVISAVFQLVAIPTLVRLVRSSRPQALVAWSTAGATLWLAPHIEWGVILGIGIATLVHLWRELHVEVRSHYAEGTLRLEPIGVLFFATAPGLEDALLTQLAAHPDANQLTLDLGKLGRVDYTGALAVKTVTEEAEQAGLTVVISGVPPQARRIMTEVLGAEALSHGR